MKADGVAWVRTDFRYGVSQSRTDQIVAAATTHGIKLLALVMAGGSLGESFTTAAERTTFRNHAVALVNRYGDRIKHWEILNELNLNRKCTAQNYAALMKVVYPAMKQADPEATVLYVGNASVEQDSPTHYGARPYLAAFYTAGGGPFMDGICHHPYMAGDVHPYTSGSWNGWNIMSALIAEMDARGDTHKPLWITEVGDPTAGSGGNLVSEAMQAQKVREVFDAAITNRRFGPLFIYSYRDRLNGDNGNTETWFGLRRRDGSSKPGHNIFKQIALADAAGEWKLASRTGVHSIFAGRQFQAKGNPTLLGATFALISPPAGVTYDAATRQLRVNAATIGVVQRLPVTIAITLHNKTIQTTQLISVS